MTAPNPRDAMAFAAAIDDRGQVDPVRFDAVRIYLHHQRMGQLDAPVWCERFNAMGRWSGTARMRFLPR